jgi:hypothetical protein
MPQLAADKIRKQTEEELFGPSRLQEEAPHFARSVGIFGLFVLLASAVMAGWNAIRLIIGGESSQLPFFGRGWINFWVTAGSAMLYFHAAFDRALEIRRSYMTLAWLALVSGALAGLIWVIHGLWGTVAAIVVSILAGLMTLAVTVSPWVMSSDQGSESNQVDGGEQVRETVNDSTAEAAFPSAPPVNWFFSRLSQLGSFLVRWNSLHRNRCGGNTDYLCCRCPDSSGHHRPGSPGRPFPVECTAFSESALYVGRDSFFDYCR